MLGGSPNTAISSMLKEANILNEKLICGCHILLMFQRKIEQNVKFRSLFYISFKPFLLMQVFSMLLAMVHITCENLFLVSTYKMTSLSL